MRNLNEKRSDDLRHQAELQIMRYDSAVRMLLMPHGNEFDWDSFHQTTGVHFCGDRFVAAQFEDDPTAPPAPLPEDSSTPSQRYQRLRDLVLSVLGREHLAVVCNQNGRMLCIVNWQTSEVNWHGSFSNLVTELNRRRWQDTGVRRQRVVSRMFRGLEQLEQARKELSEAEDYRTLMGSLPGEVVFYDGILKTVDLGNQGNLHQEEQARNRELYQSMLRGDTARAKSVFQDILEANFVTSRPAVKFVQLRIFTVIDTFLKSLEQASGELGIQDAVAGLDAAYRLLDAGDIWALKAAAMQILDEYQCIYNESRRDASLPYRIRAYIRQAYQDQNLNVNQVADQFHVTPTYATRVFKQEFGMGILTDIQQVRVEAAKRLLDSSRTIKAVASMVGLGSPAALIRIFKKYEGVTPAQYGLQPEGKAAGVHAEKEEVKA